MKPTLESITPSHYQCTGNWTLPYLDKSNINKIQQLNPNHTPIVIDGEKLQVMDTAGAYYLAKYLNNLTKAGVAFTLDKFSTKNLSLLNTVLDHLPKEICHQSSINIQNKLYDLGLICHRGLLEAQDYFTFIGKITFSSLHCGYPAFKNTIIYEIEQGGFRAIPLIASLFFLIGVVLAYQMGMQLVNYGANIYVVDLLGISLLREFAPLLTAILVAGRTGSAFTARLGTMFLQEEVDALHTMGLDPYARLVLPKIIATLIILPLLTILAEIFGILGGMVMANNMLNVSYKDFLHRFPEAIGFTTYLLGMIKTPVFAAIISSVACFQGFRVDYSADKLGKKTTLSVVHAIFLLIVTDSLFSVLFGHLGI